MDLINKQPKIFIISGKARHGKDTIAQIIKKICDEKGKKAVNVAFAFYIKEYVKKISGWDGNEETKETVRELLQQLGTEVVREKIDQFLFINRIVEDIKVYSYYFDVITISDARLVEEVETIKSKFKDVVSINVVRTGFEPVLTGEKSKHKSETGLDNYDNYDYKIINSGTIEDLELKVREIIDKEMM